MEMSKHLVKLKNKDSELPTSELQVAKAYTTFGAAWKDGVARPIKIAADTIRKKQNLRVVVGVECTIVKPRDND